EARRQAEADRAREKIRAARRLSRAAWGLGVAALLTTMLAIMAWNESSKAVAAKKDAEELREVADDQKAIALTQAHLAKVATRDAQEKEAPAKKEAAAARRSTAVRLAAQAQDSIKTHPQRAVLLAIEAVNTVRRAGDPKVPFTEQALQMALDGCGGVGLG